MASTRQIFCSSPPLYPNPTPIISNMVNDSQYGRGIMSLGARNTGYDSRRLGGPRWESDLNCSTSRFADEIIGPDSHTDRGFLHAEDVRFAGPSNNFTREAYLDPHITTVMTGNHLDLNFDWVQPAGAFGACLAAYFPEVPADALAFCGELPSNRRSGMMTLSPSNTFPSCPLALTHGLGPMNAPLEYNFRDEPIPIPLNGNSGPPVWNSTPMQLSLSPSVPSASTRAPYGEEPNLQGIFLPSFDLMSTHTLEQLIAALSQQPMSVESFASLNANRNAVNSSIFDFDGGATNAMPQPEQNMSYTSQTTTPRTTKAIKALSPDANALLATIFTNASPERNPALRKFLEEILESEFLEKKLQEPLLTHPAGRSMVGRISNIAGYPRVNLKPGARSIYTLFLEKGTNRCLFCSSQKGVLWRAVGCVRKHLGHRPFACSGCEACNANPGGPARFYTHSLLSDHIKGRTQKTGCIHKACHGLLRRGNMLRHWLTMHKTTPFPYEEYPGYSKIGSNPSVMSSFSPLTMSPDAADTHSSVLENVIEDAMLGCE